MAVAVQEFFTSLRLSRPALNAEDGGVDNLLLSYRQLNLTEVVRVRELLMSQCSGC